MIIKGVGSFMAKRAKKDGTGIEVVTLGTLQDLKIDMNVELEDIFGGDGFFAIDTLVKSKSIEITATDAKLDLNQLQLMMGSNVSEKVADYVWVLNEQGTIATNYYTPEFGGIGSKNTVYGAGNFSVRLKDDNTLLTKVNTAPTNASQFRYDATNGRLQFHSSVNGADIMVNYQREETVDLVNILAEEVPFPVHVIHHGSFLQKDGTYGGIETELYQTIAKGTFSIDAQRAAASTSSVQLQVLDPERPDGKLGSIKRYNTTKKV